MKKPWGVVAAVLFVAGFAHGQDCTPQWLNQFRLADVDDIIFDSLVLDDEDGQSLVITGKFYAVGELQSIGVARWTPSGFVNMNPTETIIGGRCLAYLDPDGAGPMPEALFAAGGQSIQWWDGSSWTKIAQVSGGDVLAMAVFDDGNGPRLWASGYMSHLGAPNGSYVAVNNLATWDGTDWHEAMPESGGEAYCMAVYDDGTGPTLYLGGALSVGPDEPFVGLVKWTPDGLVPVGGELWTDNLFGEKFVMAMVPLDLGDGTKLYVGGAFQTAGGVAANNVAVWNGTTYLPLGAGTNKAVWDLKGFDDGGGLALYAAGGFTSVDGEPIRGTAKWDGTDWDIAGSKVAGTARTLSVYTEDVDPVLYVGGQFTIPAKNIARLADTGWEPLGSGVNGPVFAMRTLDTGSGPAAYIGGEFTKVDGGTLAALNVARFDGTNWTALGGGLTGSPDDFAVFNDGNGPALYACGWLTKAGGLPVSHIARWNDSEWSGVGGGLNNKSYTMCTFDDGTGNALYAGGHFTVAGGNPVNRIARWNGSSWSAVGIGFSDAVVVLTVFDDGSGPRLFAGGRFPGRVAAWDGLAWDILPEPSHAVLAMAVFDGGSGPLLHLAGVGNNEINVSTWDGVQMVQLASGTNNGIERLLAVTDEQGPGLYAAGTFTLAGGLEAAHVARWDGSTWSALSSGLTNFQGTFGGFGLAALDDHLGTTVLVGSSYTAAGGISSGRMARWGCPPSQEGTEAVLLSFTGNTAVPGVGTVRNEDIVQYDQFTGQWSYVIDGSDVGLGPLVIDAFAVLSEQDRTFLMSFTAPVNIAGMTGGPNGSLLDDSDLVKFTASSLGSVTAGSFSFYFDASDVGLDLDSEDIDAVEVTPDGDLLISTGGNPAVTGVSGARDEDLLKFVPSGLGASTSGTWSMHFDGSDVGLATTSVEDIDAAAHSGSGDLVLSTLGDFAVTGAVGSSQDLLAFTPATLGSNTSGSFGLYQALHLLGISPTANVGGADLAPSGLGRPGGPPPCLPDLTDDGVLDLFDYLAFQACFAEGDLDADFDQSTGLGVLDAFDFLEFVAQFNEGCE
jgi:hypothetical protein